MTKIGKLLERLLSRPKNFTCSDLKRILSAYGYDEVKTGKTSGSSVAFINHGTKHIIRLHKPHPNPELKKYQIDDIIKELKKQEIIE